MYTTNRHQLILVTALMRSRISVEMWQSVRQTSPLYVQAAVQDVLEHIFSIGGYEAREGATPFERVHGLPNYMDI